MRPPNSLTSQTGLSSDAIGVSLYSMSFSCSTMRTVCENGHCVSPSAEPALTYLRGTGEAEQEGL